MRAEDSREATWRTEEEAPRGKGVCAKPPRSGGILKLAVFWEWRGSHGEWSRGAGEGYKNCQVKRKSLEDLKKLFLILK